MKGSITSSNMSLQYWLTRLAKMFSKNVEVKLNATKTAYTNGETCFIGVDGETVKAESTEKGKFLMTVGLLLHELGHVLYTPFCSRGKTLVDYGTVKKSLINGEFPESVKPSLSYNKEFFKKFGTQLSSLYDKFSNSVCDGYIEQRLLKEYPHWRKELMYMRDRWYINQETYEEIKSSGRNQILSSFSLSYALNHDLKTYGVSDENTEAFEQIKPYLDKALFEDDASSRIQAINDAFVMMVSLMDWTKPEEQSGGKGGQQQNQQQGSDDNQNQNQPSNGQSSNSSENNNSQNQNGSKNETGEKTDDNQNGSGQDSQNGQNGSDSKDGNSNGGSKDQQQNGNADEPNGSDSSQSQNGEGSDGSETNQNGNKNGETNESQTSSNGTGNGSSQGRPMTEEEIKEALSEMIKRAEQINPASNEQNSVCNEQVSVSNRGNEEGKGADGKDLEKNLQELIRDGEDTFFQTLDFSSVSLNLKKPAEDMASKLTLSLRRKLRDEKESYAKGLYVGKRLDTKRLYRADKRIMERRKYPDRPDMKVVLLVDASGSIGNDSTLHMNEKKITLSIKRTCEKLHIDCEEYAFASGLAPLKSDAEILSFRVGGGTNDANAFSYALKRMQSSKAERRMIIVVTDGCGSGHDRLEPMLKKAKSQKIGVIACGLGDDRPSVEESWAGFGAKILACDDSNYASELCQSIIKAYK